MNLRPRIQLLDEAEREEVIDQALDVLRVVGVAVENDEGLALMRAAGGEARGGRVYLGEDSVRAALQTAPGVIRLFDRQGIARLELGGDQVHFDPGSAALSLFDRHAHTWRAAESTDLAHLAWVTQSCRHYAAQSTALVPSDVPPEIADRARLFHALCNCDKPVITGTFRTDGFAPMHRMLIAVRGSEARLRELPLAVFDCCPTSPLSWSDLTCQALMDAARAGIPANLISVPLGGATAPVSLREMVVQHCAETLSGVVLHQAAAPGAPVIWGGAPSAFDMRHGTTVMGAIETTMVDMANASVGKHIGLPTHAYMAVSDAKRVDWQAGAETAQGAVLAVLAGVNLVSGPGMLGFLGCQSFEKLILDNEACGAALRLGRGISHRSADQAVGLIGEVVSAGHFLGHRHTRKTFRRELHFPGAVIDRAPYSPEEPLPDSLQAAGEEVDRIVAAGNPAPLDQEVQRELEEIMEAERSRLAEQPAAVPDSARV